MKILEIARDFPSLQLYKKITMPQTRQVFKSTTLQRKNPDLLETFQIYNSTGKKIQTSEIFELRIKFLGLLGCHTL